MAEPPSPIARLDDYLATVTIAHEAIWELRTALVVLGNEDERVERLFTEAADLAVVEVPRQLRQARRLRRRWDEQTVLDPAAADDTLELLAEELQRIDSDLVVVRTRQDEIARELRAVLLDEA